MMEVGKLLYATNASELTSSEVQRLMHLRSLGIKEVVLLQTTKVEGWETSLADFGVSCKVLMVDGPLVDAILAAARREDVQLIAARLNKVGGTRGRRTMTKDLIKSSPVPVIILPEDEPVSAQHDVFAHVIFATNWSAASSRAMSYLLKFKDIIKELEIVHVIEKKLSVRDMRDLSRRLTESRKMFLYYGIDAEGHVYAGKPSEEIMLATGDYEATCVVFGNPGKSAWKDLLSRRCSYRVAEASVVPTLVVP